ncbi:hypothetical protein ACVILH_001908 [Bradyrhizobium sp. USDA 4353]
MPSPTRGEGTVLRSSSLSTRRLNSLRCRPANAGTHTPREPFEARWSLAFRATSPPPRRMGPGSAPCRARARHGLSGTTATVWRIHGLKQHDVQTAERLNGRLDQSADNGRRTYQRVLAAKLARGLPSVRPSQIGRGRRECRVRASPMARLQKKCRRQVPQVQPTFRHSLRDGWNAYAQSPWRAGLLATMPRQCSRIARVIPASGYQDAATSRPRGCRSSAHPKDTLRHHHGHRIPTSRVVTIARNALCGEAGCGNMIMISVKTQGLFSVSELSLG